MNPAHDQVRAIVWCEDALELLDQRQLPGALVYQRLTTAAEVAQAIGDMVVRGAPAIGITAAYGVVLAARARYAESAPNWQALIATDLAMLAAARPTAVNLFWALRRMARVIAAGCSHPAQRLLAEARAIHVEDIAANQRMGELGAALLTERGSVLTHCNTGSLATGGYGTALGVIRYGYAAGLIERVYADETRPWLQGARLTAWELVQDGIPVTLLADAAAAALMRQGEVRWAMVGADRIAANGDVANKIGTYHLAVAARYHGVRLMVVAPITTVDMSIASGADIPIEQRAAEELLTLGGQPIAAAGAQVWNPSFDVTPAALVDALVTDRGVVLAPDAVKMARLMAGTT
ncbi:MAG: S-methyl-5-thioribose-1-phosphate isomerase [Candidatus Competibacteraceae bacterium]|uniref:Methylthioribose-1-phosphate isomerase n=1 Tax=Candidatus Contendobacter odensis Run_B_J11 TaxID=1400861 RepID=A0A7U7GAZ9_9GAMM|nr:S-methyl-5-thioribose-1-phosphate isomerase [Candidatus Contendobacter odensis]MBK8536428.1 S-methyl-5-thioribose-1-phosphate isomerase [Candidatus Competibacteraceae bacterium]MBK8753204.1 S-methyl-5-thioribose-1-phosphate isomerase [Candidatus Competibacteraceae bacterium]CDH44767.1 Methylthioribose-1-phosphate isomerase [Candidatus Contendobacter odensis Run_B_J11]